MKSNRTSFKLIPVIIKDGPSYSIKKLIHADSSLGFCPKEIYQSRVGESTVREWNRHKRYDSALYALTGQVRLSIFTQYNTYKELVLSCDSRHGIFLPSKSWYRISSRQGATVLNMLSGYYDAEEVEKRINPVLA